MAIQVGIIGGGIVGVASALALQEAGYAVTILEPEAVGSRTSYGNTGVLVENPWLTANNPGLWCNLPRILLNKDPRVRVEWRFLFQNLPLMVAFLSRSSEASARATALALHRLLSVSQPQHKRWIAAAGATGLLRTSGWLKVFRTAESFKAFERELSLLRETGTTYQILSPQEVASLEPALRERFEVGLLLPRACSVASPLALTERYLERFRQVGGTVEKVRVVALDPQSDRRWRIAGQGGARFLFDQVVVAAGPWSADILASLDYHVPLLWERGYHLHLAPGNGPALTRPVHVVDDGFVMTPQIQGIRVTSGVEIADRDSPPNYAQIDRAVAVAQKLAGLGAREGNPPWLGSRPSLVDGRPMIGPAPSHEGLWFNFGHHHIGLSLAPGSALLLTALMQGAKPPVDPAPFDPARLNKQGSVKRRGGYAAAPAVPGTNLP